MDGKSQAHVLAPGFRNKGINMKLNEAINASNVNIANVTIGNLYVSARRSSGEEESEIVTIMNRVDTSATRVFHLDDVAKQDETFVLHENWEPLNLTITQ